MIILDLMLPGEDRHEQSVPAARRGKRTPITCSGEGAKRPHRRVDIGADDYLRTVSTRATGCKDHAVMRRQSPASALPCSRREQGAGCDSAHPKSTCTRTSPHGKHVGLTTGESLCSRRWSRTRTRHCRRESLDGLARGREYGVFDAASMTGIRRLRRTARGRSSQSRYIQTVWGVGYVSSRRFTLGSSVVS